MDGLQDFVTDFVVLHEIEGSHLKALKSSSAKQVCICGECEGEGPVESFCCDCQAYLCNECSTQAHKKLRSYRGHKVIPVQDLDAASLQSSKVHYCNTHNKMLKLYCETCKKLACQKCYLVDHHQHSCKFVQDARKQLNDQLTFLVADGKRKLASFKNNLGEIQKVETSAARYSCVLKAKINDFFDGAVQSIEQRRQQLLAEADTECHKDLKQVWADKVFHQATISEAEDALQLADKAIKCTSDVEMISIALLSIKHLLQLQAIAWDASTFNRVVPAPVDFKGTELKANVVGDIQRKYPRNKVEVQNLPQTAVLGETVTFKIVPTLLDERSQDMVCLIMKAEVFVKYGQSKKLLSTVSLSPQPDGSYMYVVTMRLICGGKHTIEVLYDSQQVRGSLFSLKVTGNPEEGARVKKGPNWRDSNLQVKEGTVQSIICYNMYSTTLNICWDDVDGIHKYNWNGPYEVELL